MHPLRKDNDRPTTAKEEHSRGSGVYDEADRLAGEGRCREATYLRAIDSGLGAALALRFGW